MPCQTDSPHQQKMCFVSAQEKFSNWFLEKKSFLLFALKRGDLTEIKFEPKRKKKNKGKSFHVTIHFCCFHLFPSVHFFWQQQCCPRRDFYTPPKKGYQTFVLRRRYLYCIESKTKKAIKNCLKSCKNCQ
jgi:hypothetical protein